MGLYTELPADLEAVDIIIAGGGTAGCIIASRLASADPALSILVLESGPLGAGNPTVDYPVFFFGNITPGTTTASFYKSVSSDDVGGREVIVPTGNVLGGGSAINMMQYSRAQRDDFASWATPGWTADDLLPLMKRLETYHGPGSLDVHGTDGPIHVSTSSYGAPRPRDQFISVLKDQGWPEVKDLSSLDTCNGVQKSLRYASPDGKRQDTASRYLLPRVNDGKHPNLHVAVSSQVVRVLFDGKKASGVVFRSKQQQDGAVATERTVKARKLVVISAGAFGTPAILERSGIGNPEVLKRAGIPEVIADVPGVGAEYEDHNLILYAYKSSLEPEETIDAMMRGIWKAEDLITSNHGILGWNGQEATAKIRPTEEDVASFDPDLKKLWEEEYKDNPNKPLMIITLLCGFPGDPTGVPPGQYFSVPVFTVYPRSRGHIHITGPDPDDPADFYTGFFSDENSVDLKKHRWTYKKQREIIRRMGVFRGEFQGLHPAFPAESKAAIAEEKLEGPLTDIKDIEYSAEDDAAIDKFSRENVGSTWHSLGTCKMGPREKNGVVDADLNVYGVEGLKLADLSIAPKNVAANTGNTAMVIGEKAADIIIKELGLGR